MALRAILDQTQAVRTGDVTECAEFSGLAIEVHGQHRCRAPRKRRLQGPREFIWSHRICPRLYIDKHSDRTGAFDSRIGGYRSMGHSKHEMASADAASAKRELDCIRPARTANGVSDTDEIS